MNAKKKIRLNLVGLDGNAFALLGAFARQARKEGWTEAEISAVIKDASSADYDHLLRVLVELCDPTRDEGSEDES